MNPNRYNATQSGAKPFALSLLAAIACAFMIFAPSESLSGPQAAPNQSLSAAPTGAEVHSWAKEAQEKLPALKTWDKARVENEADRKLVGLIKRGYAIINQAAARGAGMSAREAANFDTQMHGLMDQIDKLTAAGGGTTATDVPDCMVKCDGAYPGWGKGKGWNRFWCKVGCIKIKVGKDGAGVGAD